MNRLIYFVVNPRAGNGRAGKIWRRLETTLGKYPVGYEAIITRKAGETAAWCRAMAEKLLAVPDPAPLFSHQPAQPMRETAVPESACDAETGIPMVTAVAELGRHKELNVETDEPGANAETGSPTSGPDCESVIIVIIGGDGTMNEAVQGLMAATEGKPIGDAVRLGFIPAGSGNEFARGHGIPLQPDQALGHMLAAMRADQRERIDVLEVNGQFAVSSVGAGLDGEVAYTANRAPYKQWMNRVRLGYAAYMLSLLRVLIFYKPCDAEITIDGKTVVLRRVWLAAVSNIPQYGGGMMINPGARPDDGMADVCVVSGMSRAGLLAAFPKVYAGRHTDHPGVSFFRGRRIRIVANGYLRLHADGEDAGLTPAELRVINRAICIVK